jgi:hypothetical protein
MVFLSDSIPSELRRVVEFLNEQMDPAEVLAIEVKQYVGKGLKTLVPRVVGQTEAARKQPIKRKQWSKDEFFAVLEKSQGDAVRAVGEELFCWIEGLVTNMQWGTGKNEVGVVPTIQRGKARYDVCRMATNQARFVFCFDKLCKKPPFSDEGMRRQLLGRINEIPGVMFDEGVLTKRAKIFFTTLTTKEAVEKVKSAAAWLIDAINAECAKEASS